MATERAFQAAAHLCPGDPITVVADMWSSPRDTCLYLRTAIIPGWGSILLSVAEVEGVDNKAEQQVPMGRPGSVSQVPVTPMTDTWILTDLDLFDLSPV